MEQRGGVFVKKRKEGSLLYALKCGGMVFVVYILTCMLFTDPGICGRAVLNGTATWREWCGAVFYIVALCIGADLVARKKKK